MGKTRASGSQGLPQTAEYFFVAYRFFRSLFCFVVLRVSQKVLGSAIPTSHKLQAPKEQESLHKC